MDFCTNIGTVYENLPCRINGYTAYNPADDYYTIVLNARLDYITNKNTFEHELRHIMNSDFGGSRDVNLIEAMGH